MLRDRGKLLCLIQATHFIKRLRWLLGDNPTHVVLYASEMHFDLVRKLPFTALIGNNPKTASKAGEFLHKESSMSPETRQDRCRLLPVSGFRCELFRRNLRGKIP